MKNVLIVSLIIILCGITHAYTKIEKMSAPNAIAALVMIDEFVKTSDPDLASTIKQFTGEDYNPELRNKLYNVILENVNHTSFFSKMVGLVSFQNIILVCMIVVACLLIVSFLKDIIIFMGLYVTMIFVKFLLNKRTLYTLGMLLSVTTMYFKPDEIENKYIRYVFIFDWLSPLFGCFIFGLTSFIMYDDYTGLSTKNKESRKLSFTQTEHGGYSEKNGFLNIGMINTFVWAVVAIYHDNWLVGVFTVMMCFFTFGFLLGTTLMGYAVGYTDDDSIIRCFGISIMLNTLMLAIRTGFVGGKIVTYVSVFETGIYFWGSFVGSLAILILSDKHYLYYRKECGVEEVIFMKIVMAICCLSMLFFGNMFDITSYKSIGGTFFVLWAMDLEKDVLEKLGTKYKSLGLAIILVNLYIVKQYISWYPEYFIF